MPKGKTLVSFKGGPNDGDVFEDFPTNRLYPAFRLPQGSGFTEELDGQIGVFVKADELPSNWSAYKTAVYDKAEPDQARPGVVYVFTSEVLVDRCSALTKEKHWCRNEAVQGAQLCKTHSMASSVELKPQLT